MRLQTLVIVLVVLLVPLATGRHDGGDLVNAVLGNSSFRAGSAGDATDLVRIRAHLAAVIDRLSRADTSHLTPLQREARARNIARLVAYARAGRFPHNPAGMPGRVPNFLDDSGAVCAVGYLIEQDCGSGAVEAIAREHQFDYVPYIDSQIVADWQAASGLSALELAMIQPTYGGGNNPPETHEEGVSDEDVLIGVLLTADVLSTIFNVAYIDRGSGSQTAGGIGILCGAVSVLYDVNREDPTDYLTVGGVVAGALGVVSLVMGVQDRESRVQLTPALDAHGMARVGLALSVTL